MSFTKKTNTRLARPAKYYIEWRDGKFSYYDKEKEVNVPVDFKSGFIVLDNDLYSITGYSDSYEKGIYSNEVRSLDDILEVKIFNKANTEVAKGKYMDIKADVVEAGGRYTRCIYILFQGEIAHVNLSGSSFMHWPDEIESKSAELFQQHFVVHTHNTDHKKGTNEFQAPHFDFGDELSESDINEAIEADTKVQEYLDVYLEGSNNKSDNGASTTDNSVKNEEAVTDTSNWKEYEINGYRLGDMKAGSIKMAKQVHEDNEDFGESYDMICAALHNQDKKETTKGAGKVKKTDVLKKKWQDVKTPKGTKLGDLDSSQRKTLLDSLEGNPKLKEKYSSIIQALHESPLLEDAAEDDEETDIPF